MTDQPSAHQHHLFVVRVWWETNDGNSPGEWRGSVEHVASRTKRYFRNMGKLTAFIEGQLSPPLQVEGEEETK